MIKRRDKYGEQGLINFVVQRKRPFYYDLDPKTDWRLSQKRYDIRCRPLYKMKSYTGRVDRVVDMNDDDPTILRGYYH